MADKKHSSEKSNDNRNGDDESYGPLGDIRMEIPIITMKIRIPSIKVSVFFKRQNLSRIMAGPMGNPVIKHIAHE